MSGLSCVNLGRCFMCVVICSEFRCFSLWMMCSGLLLFMNSDGVGMKLIC